MDNVSRLRRANGVGTERGLIAASVIVADLADARTDIFYSDAKPVKKLWWVYDPAAMTRGGFLFAKRNEPKALKGQQWYVRDLNPASYVASDTGLTAIGQIDFPVATKADAVALAEAMAAKYASTGAVKKMGAKVRAAHLAEVNAAAVARVAQNGTAR